MCKIDLTAEVGGEDCEASGGMFSEDVKIAPFNDFADIKEIPSLDVDGDNASKATIVGDHTFKAGKGFSKIVGITETAGLTYTKIGEKGRSMFQNQLVVEVAGSKAALLGFLRLAKNLKFIAIATEVGTGQKRQLGSKRLPAWFEGIEGAIEAAVEGKNSVTLTIMDKQYCPAPVYVGVVTEKPVPSE